MLRITRKEGESIIINNTIEVTVLSVKGSKVKLGCSFPQDATILRKELFEKIIAYNQTVNQELDLSSLEKFINNKD